MGGNAIKVAALAATALTTLLTAPAYAQAGDSGDASDIVVTARRVEEKLQDVPISITVFNQEQIANRNIVNAADLGNYTPSLSTNNKFGPEKASFVIRGFIQDSPTQSSVGTYFADVVGPRAGGSTPSGNGVGVGNLWDLQNVQVLKGPQGTLQGRNTTGGAVLLVPRKPTDRFEGYVEGSAGNYAMWRGQGVLNLPLADSFRVRLGVDHMERDGYLKNHSGIGPDRLGDVGFTAARLSIVADLAPDLENYVIASYSRSKNHGVVGRVVGCNRAAATAPTSNANAVFGCREVDRQDARGDGWWDVENTEPAPLIQMETWQVINTTTWQASDTLTIKNIASYAEFYEKARYSLEGEDFRNPDGSLALTLIRTNDTPGFHLSSQATYTEELQFQGNSEDGKLRWQAGGYFENSDPLGFSSQFTTQLINCQNSRTLYAAGRLQCPASATGSVSVPFQKTWYRNRGLYAQATYNLTEKFALTGGFRYTWDRMTHRYDGTSVRFPTATTSIYSCSNGVRVTNPDGTSPVIIGSFADHARCAVTFTAKSQKPTWLIDLDYKPNADTLLYAKWARGYRAGGVAAANIMFETWQPEKVDTYEVGAKLTMRGSALRGYFNIAGFYNDFRNQQIQAGLTRNPRPGNPSIGGAAIINAGKSRIWGVEVDASATVLENLRFDLGYTYLNTKVLEIVAPTIPVEAQPYFIAITPSSVVGSPLALAPKNRYTATATYTLPLDESIGRISFGATFVHTDKQISSLATLPQFGVLGASNLLSLNAGWTDVLGAPVDVSFFMTNVTKDEFPIAVAQAYNSFGLESQLTNEARMWGFRLKYHFGD